MRDLDNWYERESRRQDAQDALADHRAMLKYISSTIEHRRARGEHSDRVIVVGHHSPSKLSTKPQYEHDQMVNGAYSSDLIEFILDHPQIQLWTHGHTHHEFDYMIGSCRVMCNPRGYDGHEEQARLWRLKTVDI
jgi:hypothetical protein